MAERVTGRELEWFGSTVAFVKAEDRKGSWFSYRARVRSVLHQCGIDLVVDAGANAGQFARSLRSLYRGEIHSFEPVAAAFQQLDQAAAIDPLWHVHHLALGAHEAALPINVSENTKLSSFHRSSAFSTRRFGERAQVTGQELVSVQRLDQYLPSICPGLDQARILLKMDTQGYDQEVFRGATNLLKQVVALQSEVSLIPLYDGMPHWTETISLFEAAGFAIVGLFPVAWDALRVIEYDCLMVRSDVVTRDFSQAVGRPAGGPRGCQY
ncbi:MAG: FkbM family methyltransferase [Gemmatimonadales bacterium]|nr:FkbM family methyltransferase [Gemmatimonadales bacterium]